MPCLFIYYGTRNIRLVKDGYETLVITSRFRPPGMNIFPRISSRSISYRAIFATIRVLTYDLRPAIWCRTSNYGRADALRAAVKAEQAAEGIVPLPDDATRPT